MNILFMGTPDIAAAALEAILDAGHTVCGVYTRADKPVGRKQVLTAPPVKRTAMAHGIPVFQPGTLRDAAQAENIRALAPELIVVVAYGRILPPEVLAIPQYGCINLHVSLLPRYRGAAPVQWAVINGEKTTGVSIMYLNEGLDTGDILRVSPVEIGENETPASCLSASRRREYARCWRRWRISRRARHRRGRRMTPRPRWRRPLQKNRRISDLTRPPAVCTTSSAV